MLTAAPRCQVPPPTWTTAGLRLPPIQPLQGVTVVRSERLRNGLVRVKVRGWRWLIPRCGNTGPVALRGRPLYGPLARQQARELLQRIQQAGRRCGGYSERRLRAVISGRRPLRWCEIDAVERFLWESDVARGQVAVTEAVRADYKARPLRIAVGLGGVGISWRTPAIPAPPLAPEVPAAPRRRSHRASDPQRFVAKCSCGWSGRYFTEAAAASWAQQHVMAKPRSACAVSVDEEA